ncbi:hypothetical protein HDE_00994 [Halotydeus destructor]|nr:hypothetical protein HDE_00994 [Halotydeus destructor]
MNSLVFKLILGLLVAMAAKGEDLDLLGDVFKLVGSLLNLLGGLVGRTGPADGSSSGRAACTGKSNGTKGFQNCGLCSSAISTDETYKFNERKCLATCLFYDGDSVDKDDVGCQQKRGVSLTDLDYCACVKSDILDPKFSLNAQSLREQAQKGITAKDYTSS